MPHSTVVIWHLPMTTVISIIFSYFHSFVQDDPGTMLIPVWFQSNITSKKYLPSPQQLGCWKEIALWLGWNCWLWSSLLYSLFFSQIVFITEEIGPSSQWLTQDSSFHWENFCRLFLQWLYWSQYYCCNSHTTYLTYSFKILLIHLPIKLLF